MTTTVPMTATDTELRARELAEVRARLANCTRRARAVLDDVRPDLPGEIARWAVFLAGAEPGYELKELWRAVRHAEVTLDDLEAVVQEAARLRADAEPRRHPPAEPDVPTLEALAAYEAARAAAREARERLASLDEPVADAHRLRPVVLAALGRLVQGACSASRRFETERAVGVVAQARHTLSALRERVLAEDAEHEATVKRWSARVGRPLPVPALTWPAGPLAACACSSTWRITSARSTPPRTSCS